MAGGGIQVIELPQQPAPLGLYDLGQSLSGAASGYVAEQNKLTQRQQDQADLADARAYQQSEEDRRNKANAALEQQKQAAQLRSNIIQALINERLLDPSDVDDPQAVETAYKKAQDMGLVDQYKDLISHGYLSMDDLHKPDAVLEAQKKAAQASTAGYQASADQRVAATAQYSELSKKDTQLRAQIAQIEQAANEDPEQAAARAVDPQRVQARAVELARQAAGGRVPTPAQIQQQTEQAQQDLRAQTLQAAYQRQMQAKNTLPTLRAELQTTDSRLQNFEKMGVIAAPDAGDTDTGAAGAVVAPPPNANKAAVLSSLVAPKAAPATAAPTSLGSAPAISNPTNDPMIAAANQARRQAAVQTNIIGPIQDTIQQIAALDEQIQKTRADTNFGNIDVSGVPGMGNVPSPNPDAQAQALSALLQKRQALMAKVQQLRSAQSTLAGPAVTPAPVTGSAAAAPGVSDTDSATPQWWTPPNSQAGAALD